MNNKNLTLEQFKGVYNQRIHSWISRIMRDFKTFEEFSNYYNITLTGGCITLTVVGDEVTDFSAMKKSKDGEVKTKLVARLQNLEKENFVADKIYEDSKVSNWVGGKPEHKYVN